MSVSLKANRAILPPMPPLPNILWIVTTQWRAQATGYAGDANARTPVLDLLSECGANFVHAVTPHPFGPFARAALFTGIPSPANGVRDYFDPLPAKARTVAHELRDRGYDTAFFGKWHLGLRDPGAPLVGEAHATTLVAPELRGGFELWEGFESGFVLNDPWLHGSRLPVPVRVSGYQSAVVCRRAEEWVRQESAAQRQPWFCVASVEPPHPPYDAPADGVPALKPDALVMPANVPRGGDVERQARAELAGYYAHIQATDQAIGKMLNAIDRQRTVVIVTSVHGDMHGSHGLFRKGWPYEESIRVPLLVSVPDSLGGAAWRGNREELVSLLDVPRWCTAWADGQRVGVPEAAAQQISMPSVVRLPHQCDRPWRSVRTRMRKLVVDDSPAPDGKPRSAPWLYFDLEKDPLEERNLAAEPVHRREIEALQSLIKLPPGGG